MHDALPRSRSTVCTLALTLLVLLPSLGTAADRTWSGASDDNWNTGANWGGTPPTPGGGDTVTFNATDTGGANVLDQGYTVSGMTYTGGGVHGTDLNGMALQVNGNVDVGNGANVDGTATWTGGGTNTIGAPADLKTLYIGRHTANHNSISDGNLTISGGTVVNAFVSEFRVGEKQAYGLGGGDGTLTIGAGSILSIGTNGSTTAHLGIGLDIQTFGGSIRGAGTLDASAGALDLNLGQLNIGYRTTTGGPATGTFTAGTNSQIDATTLRIGYAAVINNNNVSGTATLLDSSQMTADNLYIGYHRNSFGTLDLAANAMLAVNDAVLVASLEDAIGMVTGGVDCVVNLGSDANPLATFRVGHHTVNNAAVVRGKIELSQSATSQVVVADGSTVKIGVKDTIANALGQAHGLVRLGNGANFKVGTAGNNTAILYMGSSWVSQDSPIAAGTLDLSNGSVALYLDQLYMGYRQTAGANLATLIAGSNNVINATTIRLGYGDTGGNAAATVASMTLGGTTQLDAVTMSIGIQRLTTGTLTIDDDADFTGLIDNLVVGDIRAGTGDNWREQQHRETGHRCRPAGPASRGTAYRQRQRYCSRNDRSELMYVQPDCRGRWRHGQDRGQGHLCLRRRNRSRHGSARQRILLQSWHGWKQLRRGSHRRKLDNLSNCRHGVRDTGRVERQRGYAPV